MLGHSASLAPAVLIVDDEPLVRMAAADTVADAGVASFEAADGGEALELIKAHPEIALVVTDVEMPGMDGVTLARRACTLPPALGISSSPPRAGGSPGPICPVAAPPSPSHTGLGSCWR